MTRNAEPRPLGGDRARVGPNAAVDAFSIPALALLELDTSGVITGASAAFCDLVGRPLNDLAGRRPAEFTHPDDVSLSPLSHMDPQTGCAGQVTRYLRPGGEQLSVHVSAVWLPEQGRLIAHVTDVTDVIDRQEAARRASLRYEALVEHSTDLIFVVDKEGRLADANPATVRLIGERRGDAAESLLRELVHREDIGNLLTALRDAFARPGVHPTVTFRLADGNGRWVDLEASANSQLADPAVRGIVINARDITKAVDDMQRTKTTMRSMIGALVRATELRDPYTAGHEMKVAAMSRRIAEHLALPGDQCLLIELGASVHDIGKIAIPAEILTRPGRLSALEFEMVKTHCRVGYGILVDVDLPSQITDIVLHHHERLDGSGYPDGLVGDAISLPARIVAVADVIDAMASHRPYRPALGMAAARAEIQRGRGLQYDPRVADAALDITAALREGPATGLTPIDEPGEPDLVAQLA